MATQTGSIDLKAAKKAHDDAEKVATNYVADISNGILVHPDNDNTNGVKITDKVEVIRNSTSVAEFGESATIGISDGTQSFLSLDYHSMQMIDRDGNAYFYVSDLRDSSGNVTATHTGDGVTTLFEPLSGTLISTVTEVTINGVSTTQYTYTASIVLFTTAPSNGSTIVIKYIPDNASFVKAFTAGLRWTGQGDVGPMSFVENTQNVASGFSSHAEGQHTQSTGTASHSEGSYTYATRAYAHSEGLYSHADGYCSHAQNSHTKATSDYQTALGQYNVEDNADTYAVIIGNGTGDNARSNALTVDWDGNVQMALDTTAASGTDHDLYAAINALGWASDVIV